MAVLLGAVFACVALARAEEKNDWLIYVSNERSGDVTVIDGLTRTALRTFPVGKRPRGIHLSSDGRTLYVAVSGSPRLGPGADPERAKDQKADKSADGIAIVDAAAGKVRRKLEVGSDPEQFALSPEGSRVFVSNEDEGTLSCWDIDSGKKIFATKVTEEPEGVAVHPVLSQVYVTCEAHGDVFILDQQNGGELARFQVHGRPRSVAFLPDALHAYIPAEGEAEVSLVDTVLKRVERVIKIEGPDVRPMGALASPDGKAVFVSTGQGNTVAVIDPDKNLCVGSIAVGGRPWGIALSPDGGTLYTANGKTDDVSVVDPVARKELMRVKAGQGPWGLAVGPKLP